MNAISHEKLKNKGHIITTAISATSQRPILLRYVFCFIILFLFWDNYAGLRELVYMQSDTCHTYICNSDYRYIHLGVCNICLIFLLWWSFGMPSEFLPSKNEAFKLVYTYNKNAIYMCLRSANLFVCKDTTFFQNTIKNNVIRNDIMPGE